MVSWLRKGLLINSVQKKTHIALIVFPGSCKPSDEVLSLAQGVCAFPGMMVVSQDFATLDAFVRGPPRSSDLRLSVFTCGRGRGCVLLGGQGGRQLSPLSCVNGLVWWGAGRFGATSTPPASCDGENPGPRGLVAVVSQANIPR